MTPSILQSSVAALVHSATSSSPALRGRYRRDSGDGSLGPGEIMSFVGALLSLIVVIPGLVMVWIQARKYWQQRSKKNTPNVELNIAISENLDEPISSAVPNNITTNINNPWSARSSRHGAALLPPAATFYDGMRPKQGFGGAESMDAAPPGRASTWPRLWHLE